MNNRHLTATSTASLNPAIQSGRGANRSQQRPLCINGTQQVGHCQLSRGRGRGLLGEVESAPTKGNVMTWEWSHTATGERNVEQNIRRIKDETLAIIYAEWSASSRSSNGYSFNPKQYDRALGTARMFINKGMKDLIQDTVIEHVFNLRECSNGGHDAYVCPYGCHTVSFNLEGDEDE